jgi:hypothetical protein
MIIWLSFFIPILTTIVLLLFWGKKVAWFELVIKIVAVFLVILCAKGCSTAFLTDDDEFWTYKAVSVWHEDEWDEWIEKTCTEEYACGTDSKGNTKYCTRTYDCSYRDYHPDEYYFVDEYGSQHSISKEEYLKYRDMWGNNSFVEMNRDFYHIDGDAHKSVWDGKRTSIKIFVDKHTYENKIIASKNVFNFEKIAPEEAVKRGLFDYPNTNYKPSVLSVKNWPWKEAFNKDADYTNAVLGPKKQVRIWYVLFDNKPSLTGRWQESYWQGGNKNEFVICVSLDKAGKVQWCHVFSWTDNRYPVVKVQHLIAEQGIFDPLKTNLEVEKILQAQFERKHFKDFSYLEIEPTNAAIIWTYILVILFSVGSSVWIIMNEIDEDTKL